MVRQFGEAIAGELETAVENMEAIRYVLNILAVQTWLWTEGENRYVTIQCAIGGQKDLSLTHTAINGYKSRSQTLVVTVQLMLPAPRQSPCPPAPPLMITFVNSLAI